MAQPRNAGGHRASYVTDATRTRRGRDARAARAKMKRAHASAFHEHATMDIGDEGSSSFSYPPAQPTASSNFSAAPLVWGPEDETAAMHAQVLGSSDACASSVAPPRAAGTSVAAGFVPRSVQQQQQQPRMHAVGNPRTSSSLDPTNPLMASQQQQQQQAHRPVAPARPVQAVDHHTLFF